MNEYLSSTQEEPKTANTTAGKCSLQVPAWLWPNILSLDAVAVAVLWQQLLARCLMLSTGLVEPLVLGLSVWVIYLFDHILDVSGPLELRPEPLRKQFFRLHRRKMMVTNVVAFLIAAALSVSFIDPALFRLGLGVCAGILLYFGLVHMAPSSHRSHWAREAIVALFFVGGTSMPFWMMTGKLHYRIAVYALPFFVLCWTNCCLVESWEWESTAPGNPAPRPHVSTGWAARNAAALAGANAGLSLVLWFIGLVPLNFAVAVLIASLLFVLLFGFGKGVSTDVRCFAVDLALLSPFPVLACAGVLERIAR